MKSVRTAVIGVGHLGAHHTRIYSKLKSVELAGVYDTDRNKAEQMAETYGTQAFESLDRLIENCDAASLAVPTDLHWETGLKVLGGGVHLLVEKPITETVDQARQLVDLAKKNNLVLQVGHVERFNPALIAAQDYINDSLFVDCLRLAPFNVRGTEVPVVLDLMIHDIDIILGIVGRPVKRVSASGTPVMTNKIDIANARIEFEGGAVANVVASRVSMERVRKMRFFARENYVSVDMMKKEAVRYRKRPGVEIDLERSGGIGVVEMLQLVERDSLKVNRKADPLTLELENFIHCVSSGETPVVSGQDGLHALAEAERIMQAIESSLNEAGIRLES